MYHRFEVLVRVSLLHARGDPWQETEQQKQNTIFLFELTSC